MLSVSSSESPRSRNAPRDNTSSSSTGKQSPPVHDLETRLGPYFPETRSKSSERQQQETVLARVKDELEVWENLVFSFDMERGRAEGNDDGATESNNRSSRQGRRSATSGRNIDGGSQVSIDSLLSGATFSGVAPQQQQITQLAHLAQLAQLSQLNTQYNLGFDLNTLNQLAAMNVLSPALNTAQQLSTAPFPPQSPEESAAQTFRHLQSQGMLGGSNSNSSNATPNFAFPSFSSQAQPHHQTYMQAAQSQELHWGPLPSGGSPPLGHNVSGVSASHGGSQIPQQRPAPPFLPPLTFPPSTGLYSFNASPNATAGPSTIRPSSSGNRASPSSPAASQDGGGDADDTLVQEDKRRRNTAASARFRIKKKHKVMSLEKSVSELEDRAEDLEREASDLRRENGWLKEMLIMKGRRGRGAEVAQTSKDDDDEGEGDDSGKDEGSEKGDDEDQNKTTYGSRSDRKGKGKGKAED